MTSMRLLVMVVLLMAAPIGLAGYGMIPDLQPRHYASASGAYVLLVDPSQRSGGGGATYELRHEGVVVWQRKHEFTFWEAVIANDGAVGGYGYSRGYQGERGNHGEFFVAMLDPAGAVRFRHSVPRQPARAFHTMADPKGYGVLFNAESGQMIIRATKTDAALGREFWTVYALAGGVLVGEFSDVELMADSTPTIVDAQPVAGTPLTLILGFGSGGAGVADSDAACLGPTKTGPMFVLVDANYTPIWTLAFDEDSPGLDKPRYEIRDEIRRLGGILASDQPGQFDLRDPISGERVTYVVNADPLQPEAWKVQRVAVAPHVQTDDVNAPMAESVPAIELEKLGRIELDGGDAEPYRGPVREVFDFDIDDRGRFGFVEVSCQQGTREAALVIVDDQGELVRKLEIEAATEGAGCYLSPKLAWQRDDNWLVDLSDAGSSKVYRIELANSESTLLAAFESFVVKALEPQLDGGFVVLANAKSRYTHSISLSAYDAEGRMRWTVDSDSSDDTKPTYPEGIAVTASGDVVVLDRSGNKLKIYGEDGVYRASLELESAWNREPRYPSDLTADGSGAVIVHDYSGDPPIVHMMLDGTVLAELVPRYGNGQRFQPGGDIRSGPDGRLWTSNGDALMRLGDDGVVDRVLGRAPDTASLGASAAITVASNGLIYVADEKTGTVHAFGRDGARVLVAEPSVSDYDEDLSSASLTVSDDGDIFVSHSSTTVVQYTPEGQRVGIASIELPEVSQTWYAQPGSRNRWILGYPNVYLVDGDGQIVRRIERTAHARWLHSPGPAGVAPDGSLAVMSEAIVLHFSEPTAPPTVTLYSATGEPLDTWPAPQGAVPWADFAFDGTHLAFLSASEEEPDSMSILVTDISGEPLFQLPAVPGKTIAAVFLVPTGRTSELWLYDGEYAIDRYAMPQSH